MMNENKTKNQIKTCPTFDKQKSDTLMFIGTPSYTEDIYGGITPTLIQHWYTTPHGLNIGSTLLKIGSNTKSILVLLCFQKWLNMLNWVRWGVTTCNIKECIK